MLSRQELKKLLPIDLSDLDQECAQQADLFDEASDLASESRAEAKAAKHTLEAVKADIELQFHRGELESGIKITTTSIVALVNNHKDVIACKEELVVKEKEASKCEGLAHAFDQRRSMLNNEVTLAEQRHYHYGDVDGRKSSSVTQDDIVKKRRSRGRESEKG